MRKRDEDGRRGINYAQWTAREARAASDRPSPEDEASSAILEVIKRRGANPASGKIDFFRGARLIEKENSKS